eukprot:5989-Heterococcus_DN1.PRE.1
MLWCSCAANTIVYRDEAAMKQYLMQRNPYDMKAAVRSSAGFAVVIFRLLCVYQRKPLNYCELHALLRALTQAVHSCLGDVHGDTQAPIASKSCADASLHNVALQMLYCTAAVALNQHCVH